METPSTAVTPAAPATPGVANLRWSSRAQSVASIEAELTKIWASTKLPIEGEGGEERRISARTSVLNLVVIARRPELGEHAAAVVTNLAGRHPSRTLIVSPADPDGPSWLDARIQAQCMLPRPDAAETCIELIYLTVGGESGRHLNAIVAPLLVHDLPVTVWWPGDTPLGLPMTRELFEIADRVVIDGSSWSGDGLSRLVKLAELLDDERLDVVDLALLRQSRWREAIASVFDQPDLLPFIRSIRSIAVSYASHEGAEVNVVRPLYHVAWLLSRLGLVVEQPLRALPEGGYEARLRARGHYVAVFLRPQESAWSAGTTLKVDLVAERSDRMLDIAVTADGEGVVVVAALDGEPPIERHFLAHRRTETDLIAETIETVGSDPTSRAAIRGAAALAGAAR
ncbi:MAG: glucose-6-phosphate dehydrogenase assembly protein OpcA [Chloroflexi bacterium]|nr:glucose-6-phosphate dehydrogenase assembly protein OpcA [Chloroflexota bacterium]